MAATPKKIMERTQEEAARRIVQIVKEGIPLERAILLGRGHWPYGLASWDTVERLAKKMVAELPPMEKKEDQSGH